MAIMLVALSHHKAYCLLQGVVCDETIVKLLDRYDP